MRLRTTKSVRLCINGRAFRQLTDRLHPETATFPIHVSSRTLARVLTTLTRIRLTLHIIFFIAVLCFAYRHASVSIITFRSCPYIHKVIFLMPTTLFAECLYVRSYIITLLWYWYCDSSTALKRILYFRFFFFLLFQNESVRSVVRALPRKPWPDVIAHLHTYLRFFFF